MMDMNPKQKKMLVEKLENLFQKKNIVTKDFKTSNFKAIELDHKEQQSMTTKSSIV